MGKQVFLGGACGTTTWRADAAIPILEAAGVTYHNPQLRPGEWTPAHEVLDMKAKAEADVLLFVIAGSTRGVAGIAEVSYLLAAGRPLALVVEDVPADAVFGGRVVGNAERDDLNRGRLFVRTMAAQQGVPVFADVADAAAHAVSLVLGLRPCAELEQVRAVLRDVACGEYGFAVEEATDGFHLLVKQMALDLTTGNYALQTGRRWFIPRGATRDEVVRTAFKAAVTWAEHETRELFTYHSARVFGPHLDVGRLVAAARDAGN
jgi:hypothetical protein